MIEFDPRTVEVRVPILPNLTVETGAAEHGKPQIAKLFTVGA